MALTLGEGPLASPGGGAIWISPEPHGPRAFLWPYNLRIRASVGRTIVLDSVNAALLYEHGSAPVVIAPFEDFDRQHLGRNSALRTCPVKGVAQAWDVAGPAGTRTEAMWLFLPEPQTPRALHGLAALDPTKVDAWFVEDDRAVGGIKDPFHRVDVFAASRPVEVLIAGELIARTSRAKLLLETGLPPVAYIPAVELRVPCGPGSGKTTVCPYKGEASYWTVADRIDVAWSYEFPLAEAASIQGCWAFDTAHPDVVVRFVP